MKISFFTRGKYIQARLNDSSKSLRFSTGIKVNSGVNLDSEKKLLASLYNSLNDIYLVRDKYLTPKEEEATDSYMLDDLCHKYVDMMYQGHLLTKSNRKFSKASISLYKYVANNLKEFNQKLDLSKSHIDANIPNNEKRIKSNTFNQFFNKFDKYLIDKDISVASRSDIMNIAGLMIKYWSKHFFFTIPDVPRITKNPKPVVVYSPDFTKKFIKDTGDLYNSLSDEMKTTWEISATILITTMRISDVISLTAQHINFTSEGATMRKKNIKTGIYSEIPLPSVLTDKYKYNLERHGGLFTLNPTLELVYSNIEGLFKNYDEGKESVTVGTTINDGTESLISKPMYKWTRPHLLRKTAITTMIYNNVPERFIKFASGHSANSNAFERYVGHVEKYFKSEISGYYDKLLS
jgi:integrase